MKAEKSSWVRETKFGRWFLSTHIWFKYVLKLAVQDLKHIAGNRIPENPRVLDVGCGQGQSFKLLDQHLKPSSIVGVDIDKDLVAMAEIAGKQCNCPVQIKNENAEQLSFTDNSFEVIFCHQLIHHSGSQKALLYELHRVLAPGGTILISESCKPFIEIITVRLLFKHPKHSQKTAEGYTKLVRSIGFSVNEGDIEMSTPWWSLLDFGLAKKWGFKKDNYQTTEVLIVGMKE